MEMLDINEEIAVKEMKVKKEETKDEMKVKEEETKDEMEEKEEKEMVQKKVLTEDLGKQFEMGICMLYGIAYDGKYKYTYSSAEALSERMCKLKELFPYNIRHIAKNGSPYDFVREELEVEVEEGEEKMNAYMPRYLSAKTTKKDGKVCPQVIGQPSRKKFCEYFALNMESTLEDIKMYIEEPLGLKKLLHMYIQHTFDCPVIYYNKHKNLLLFIQMKEQIDWDKYIDAIQFSHNVKKRKWNESTSISINKTTIGEFQVHNHRDCIKFRWAFEKILTTFSENFDVVYI